MTEAIKVSVVGWKLLLIPLLVVSAHSEPEVTTSNKSITVSYNPLIIHGRRRAPVISYFPGMFGKSISSEESPMGDDMESYPPFTLSPEDGRDSVTAWKPSYDEYEDDNSSIKMYTMGPPKKDLFDLRSEVSEPPLFPSQEYGEFISLPPGDENWRVRLNEIATATEDMEEDESTVETPDWKEVVFKVVKNRWKNEAVNFSVIRPGNYSETQTKGDTVINAKFERLRKLVRKRYSYLLNDTFNVAIFNESVLKLKTEELEKLSKNDLEMFFVFVYAEQPDFGKFESYYKRLFVPLKVNWREVVLGIIQSRYADRTYDNVSLVIPQPVNTWGSDFIPFHDSETWNKMLTMFVALKELWSNMTQDKFDAEQYYRKLASDSQLQFRLEGLSPFEIEMLFVWIHQNATFDFELFYEFYTNIVKSVDTNWKKQVYAFIQDLYKNRSDVDVHEPFDWNSNNTVPFSNQSLLFERARKHLRQRWKLSKGVWGISIDEFRTILHQDTHLHELLSLNLWDFDVLFAYVVQNFNENYYAFRGFLNEIIGVVEWKRVVFLLIKQMYAGDTRVVINEPASFVDTPAKTDGNVSVIEKYSMYVYLRDLIRKTVNGTNNLYEKVKENVEVVRLTKGWNFKELFILRIWVEQNVTEDFIQFHIFITEIVGFPEEVLDWQKIVYGKLKVIRDPFMEVLEFKAVSGGNGSDMERDTEMEQIRRSAKSNQTRVENLVTNDVIVNVANRYNISVGLVAVWFEQSVISEFSQFYQFVLNVVRFRDSLDKWRESIYKLMKYNFGILNLRKFENFDEKTYKNDVSRSLMYEKLRGELRKSLGISDRFVISRYHECLKALNDSKICVWVVQDFVRNYTKFEMFYDWLLPSGTRSPSVPKVDDREKPYLAGTSQEALLNSVKTNREKKVRTRPPLLQRSLIKMDGESKTSFSAEMDESSSFSEESVEEQSASGKHLVVQSMKNVTIRNATGSIELPQVNARQIYNDSMSAHSPVVVNTVPDVKTIELEELNSPNISMNSKAYPLNVAAAEQNRVNTSNNNLDAIRYSWLGGYGMTGFEDGSWSKGTWSVSNANPTEKSVSKTVSSSQPNNVEPTLLSESPRNKQTGNSTPPSVTTTLQSVMGRIQNNSSAASTKRSKIIKLIIKKRIKASRNGTTVDDGTTSSSMPTFSTQSTQMETKPSTYSAINLAAMPATETITMLTTQISPKSSTSGVSLSTRAVSIPTILDAFKAINIPTTQTLNPLTTWAQTPTAKSSEPTRRRTKIIKRIRNKTKTVPTISSTLASTTTPFRTSMAPITLPPTKTTLAPMSTRRFRQMPGGWNSLEENEYEDQGEKVTTVGLKNATVSAVITLKTSKPSWRRKEKKPSKRHRGKMPGGSNSIEDLESPYEGGTTNVTTTPIFGKETSTMMQTRATFANTPSISTSAATLTQSTQVSPNTVVTITTTLSSLATEKQPSATTHVDQTAQTTSQIKKKLKIIKVKKSRLNSTLLAVPDGRLSKPEAGSERKPNITNADGMRNESQNNKDNGSLIAFDSTAKSYQVEIPYDTQTSTSPSVEGVWEQRNLRARGGFPKLNSSGGPPADAGSQVFGYGYGYGYGFGYGFGSGDSNARSSSYSSSSSHSHSSFAGATPKLPEYSQNNPGEAKFTTSTSTTTFDDAMVTESEQKKTKKVKVVLKKRLKSSKTKVGVGDEVNGTQGTVGTPTSPGITPIIETTSMRANNSYNLITPMVTRTSMATPIATEALTPQVTLSTLPMEVLPPSLLVMTPPPSVVKDQVLPPTTTTEGLQLYPEGVKSKKFKVMKVYRVTPKITTTIASTIPASISSTYKSFPTPRVSTFSTLPTRFLSYPTTLAQTQRLTTIIPVTTLKSLSTAMCLGGNVTATINTFPLMQIPTEIDDDALENAIHVIADLIQKVLSGEPIKLSDISDNFTRNMLEVNGYESSSKDLPPTQKSHRLQILITILRQVVLRLPEILCLTYVGTVNEIVDTVFESINPVTETSKTQETTVKIHKTKHPTGPVQMGKGQANTNTTNKPVVPTTILNSTGFDSPQLVEYKHSFRADPKNQSPKEAKPNATFGDPQQPFNPDLGFGNIHQSLSLPHDGSKIALQQSIGNDGMRQLMRIHPDEVKTKKPKQEIWRARSLIKDETEERRKMDSSEESDEETTIQEVKSTERVPNPMEKTGPVDSLLPSTTTSSSQDVSPKLEISLNAIEAVPTTDNPTLLIKAGYASDSNSEETTTRTSTIDNISTSKLLSRVQDAVLTQQFPSQINTVKADSVSFVDSTYNPSSDIDKNPAKAMLFQSTPIIEKEPVILVAQVDASTVPAQGKEPSKPLKINVPNISSTLAKLKLLKRAKTTSKPMRATTENLDANINPADISASTADVSDLKPRLILNTTEATSSFQTSLGPSNLENNSESNKPSTISPEDISLNTPKPLTTQLPMTLVDLKKTDNSTAKTSSTGDFMGVSSYVPPKIGSNTPIPVDSPQSSTQVGPKSIGNVDNILAKLSKLALLRKVKNPTSATTDKKTDFDHDSDTRDNAKSSNGNLQSFTGGIVGGSVRLTSSKPDTVDVLGEDDTGLWLQTTTEGPGYLLGVSTEIKKVPHVSNTEALRSTSVDTVNDSNLSVIALGQSMLFDEDTTTVLVPTNDFQINSVAVEKSSTIAVPKSTEEPVSSATSSISPDMMLMRNGVEPNTSSLVIGSNATNNSSLSLHDIDVMFGEESMSPLGMIGSDLTHILLNRHHSGSQENDNTHEVIDSDRQFEGKFTFLITSTPTPQSASGKPDFMYTQYIPRHISSLKRPYQAVTTVKNEKRKGQQRSMFKHGRGRYHKSYTLSMNSWRSTDTPPDTQVFQGHELSDSGETSLEHFKTAPLEQRSTTYGSNDIENDFPKEMLGRLISEIGNAIPVILRGEQVNLTNVPGPVASLISTRTTSKNASENLNALAELIQSSAAKFNTTCRLKVPVDGTEVEIPSKNTRRLSFTLEELQRLIYGVKMNNITSVAEAVSFARGGDTGPQKIDGIGVVRRVRKYKLGKPTRYPVLTVGASDTNTSHFTTKSATFVENQTSVVTVSTGTFSSFTEPSIPVSSKLTTKGQPTTLAIRLEEVSTVQSVKKTTANLPNVIRIPKSQVVAMIKLCIDLILSRLKNKPFSIQHTQEDRHFKAVFSNYVNLDNDELLYVISTYATDNPDIKTPKELEEVRTLITRTKLNLPDSVLQEFVEELIRILESKISGEDYQPNNASNLFDSLIDYTRLEAPMLIFILNYYSQKLPESTRKNYEIRMQDVRNKYAASLPQNFVVELVTYLLQVVEHWIQYQVAYFELISFPVQAILERYDLAKLDVLKIKELVELINNFVPRLPEGLKQNVTQRVSAVSVYLAKLGHPLAVNMSTGALVHDPSLDRGTNGSEPRDIEIGNMTRYLIVSNKTMRINEEGPLNESFYFGNPMKTTDPVSLTTVRPVHVLPVKSNITDLPVTAVHPDLASTDDSEVVLVSKTLLFPPTEPPDLAIMPISASPEDAFKRILPKAVTEESSSSIPLKSVTSKQSTKPTSTVASSRFSDNQIPKSTPTLSFSLPSTYPSPAQIVSEIPDQEIPIYVHLIVELIGRLRRNEQIAGPNVNDKASNLLFANIPRISDPANRLSSLHFLLHVLKSLAQRLPSHLAEEYDIVISSISDSLDKEYLQNATTVITLPKDEVVKVIQILIDLILSRLSNKPFNIQSTQEAPYIKTVITKYANLDNHKLLNVISTYETENPDIKMPTELERVRTLVTKTALILPDSDLTEFVEELMRSLESRVSGQDYQPNNASKLADLLINYTNLEAPMLIFIINSYSQKLSENLRKSNEIRMQHVQKKYVASLPQNYVVELVTYLIQVVEYWIQYHVLYFEFVSFPVQAILEQYDLANLNTAKVKEISQFVTSFAPRLPEGLKRNVTQRMSRISVYIEKRIQAGESDETVVVSAEAGISSESEITEEPVVAIEEVPHLVHAVVTVLEKFLRHEKLDFSLIEDRVKSVLSRFGITDAMNKRIKLVSLIELLEYLRKLVTELPENVSGKYEQAISEIREALGDDPNVEFSLVSQEESSEEKTTLRSTTKRTRGTSRSRSRGTIKISKKTGQRINDTAVKANATNKFIDTVSEVRFKDEPIGGNMSIIPVEKSQVVTVIKILTDLILSRLNNKPFHIQYHQQDKYIEDVIMKYVQLSNPQLLIVISAYAAEHPDIKIPMDLDELRLLVTKTTLALPDSVLLEFIEELIRTIESRVNDQNYQTNSSSQLYSLLSDYTRLDTHILLFITNYYIGTQSENVRKSYEIRMRDLQNKYVASLQQQYVVELVMYLIQVLEYWIQYHTMYSEFVSLPVQAALQRNDLVNMDAVKMKEITKSISSFLSRLPESLKQNLTERLSTILVYLENEGNRKETLFENEQNITGYKYTNGNSSSADGIVKILKYYVVENNTLHTVQDPAPNGNTQLDPVQVNGSNKLVRHYYLYNYTSGAGGVFNNTGNQPPIDVTQMNATGSSNHFYVNGRNYGVTSENFTHDNVLYHANKAGSGMAGGPSSVLGQNGMQGGNYGYVNQQNLMGAPGVPGQIGMVGGHPGAIPFGGYTYSQPAYYQQPNSVTLNRVGSGYETRQVQHAIPVAVQSSHYSQPWMQPVNSNPLGSHATPGLSGSFLRHNPSPHFPVQPQHMGAPFPNGQASVRISPQFWYPPNRLNPGHGSFGPMGYIQAGVNPYFGPGILPPTLQQQRYPTSWDVYSRKSAGNTAAINEPATSPAAEVDEESLTLSVSNNTQKTLQSNNPVSNHNSTRKGENRSLFFLRPNKKRKQKNLKKSKHQESTPPPEIEYIEYVEYTRPSTETPTTKKAKAQKIRSSTPPVPVTTPSKSAAINQIVNLERQGLDFVMADDKPPSKTKSSKKSKLKRSTTTTTEIGIVFDLNDVVIENSTQNIGETRTAMPFTRENTTEKAVLNVVFGSSEEQTEVIYLSSNEATEKAVEMSVETVDRPGANKRPHDAGGTPGKLLPFHRLKDIPFKRRKKRSSPGHPPSHSLTQHRFRRRRGRMRLS